MSDLTRAVIKRRLTWALEPPMPKLLTDTRLRRSVGQANGFKGTWILALSQGTIASQVRSVVRAHLGIPTLWIGVIEVDIGQNDGIFQR
jgi:hypothetical protein